MMRNKILIFFLFLFLLFISFKSSIMKGKIVDNNNDIGIHNLSAGIYSHKNVSKFIISFDSRGGSLVSNIEVLEGYSIGTLPISHKENYLFDGWYDENQSKINEEYIPSRNITLFAKWTKIVCKKGTVLQTEICSNPFDGGCMAAGYALGDEIVYGQIPSSNEFMVGDIFDCDVDGSGYHQRFYYLRSIEDRAVLISNQNFEGADGQQNIHNYVYDEALTKLPSLDQWNSLPITFDSYAARFVTLDDLKKATGNTNLTQIGSLEHLSFLFENSGYANSDGRSTVWILEENDKRYRYHKNGRNVVVISEREKNTSKNCVRPVIEVPLSFID